MIIYYTMIMLFINNTFLFKNRSIGGGISPINSRHTIQNQKSELAGSSNGFNVRGVNSSSPIRLNVNRL